MDMPKKVVLDLNGCKYLDELHKRLSITFDFPAWYGENWSAFWDLLREPDDYTIVEIKGFTKLPKDLKTSGEKMIEIMQRNKEEQEEFMKKHPQFDYRFEYKIID